MEKVLNTTVLNKGNKISIWINLAISDLTSSRILYEVGQFRTSYFLFQQATEKANKAFALYADLIQEDELADIRHDQFKMYRRSIVKQEAELKHFIAVTETLPSKIKNHEMFGFNTVQSVHKGQVEIIRLIDGLKNRDLINISSVELNKIYKELFTSTNTKIILPKNFDRKFQQTILKLADWVGDFETPEAIAARKEYLKIVNDKKKSKELFAVMVKVLKITTDFAFIFCTLVVCGLLTIQHSSLTRYPVQGQNPLDIYTSKLPIIKKQPLFMELLKRVLVKMKELVKKGDGSS